MLGPVSYTGCVDCVVCDPLAVVCCGAKSRAICGGTSSTARFCLRTRTRERGSILSDAYRLVIVVLYTKQQCQIVTEATWLTRLFDFLVVDSFRSS